MQLLTQIIRLLLTMVPDQRGSVLREEPVPYGASFESRVTPLDIASEPLLTNIPMP
jgi:hypothetical protein